MGNVPIKDMDPPVAPVIYTAGALDVAAGAVLLGFSEWIHHIVGVVLILFGLFLLYYASRVGAAVKRERAQEQEEAQRKAQDKERKPAADSGSDGPREAG